MRNTWLVGLVVVWVSGCKVDDPCAAVECGAGRCVLDRGVAACLCEPQHRADGLRCVAIDPCEGLSCEGLPGSRCVEHSGLPTCACPADKIAHEGVCAPRDACLPNPCQQPRRTTCVVVEGAATCVCDPGFAPDGQGCAALPVWTCSAPHDGDAAEPDECPPSAPLLAEQQVVERTLSPAGDHDWFRVNPTPGDITWFEAVNDDGQLPLLIEVFDLSGTRLLASDQRGLPNAGVAFVSSEPVMVRVRSPSATATGAYRASQRSLGRDDFTNDPDTALSLSPGASFSGAIQYPGDLDLRWLELTPGEAVRLHLDASLGELELRRGDGVKRTLRDGEEVRVAVATAERWLLTMRGVNQAPGPFTVLTGLAGRDDHSDEPTFATALPSDGVALGGELEEATDVDTFVVEQRQGRVYRARWQAVTGTSLPAVTVTDPGGAVLARSRNGEVTIGWKATGDARVVLVVTDSRITSQPGRYALAVDELGPDDHADSVSGATPVTLQVPVSGRVDLASDLDVFAIRPPVGHVLRATLTSPTQSPALRVSIEEPNGQVSAGAMSAGLVVTQGGLHLITVSAPVAALTPYTLVVTDEGADDHGATLASATPLALAAWGEGSTQFIGDVDVFALTLSKDHVYRLTCTHDFASRPCELLDPSGAVVLGPLVSGSTPFLASTAGVYGVRVTSQVLGAERVRVEELGPEDFASTPADATPLAPGASLDGGFAFADDLDVFSVNAQPRRVYEVTLDASSSQASLWLMTGTGARLREVNGRALAFSSDLGGPTFIGVLNRTGATGAYRLTLTAQGLDDHGDSSAGATALTTGVTLSGALDFTGDVDAFHVTLAPNRHFRARCAATTGPCSVRVRTASGATVIRSPYESSTADVFFRAPSGVTEAWLELSSSSTTPYAVSLVDLGADDVGDTPSEATALTLDAPALVRALEVPDDVDTFSITAAAGEVIAVQCEAVSGPACRYTVLNAAGADVGAFGFRATTAGVFTVVVSNGTGAVGSYRLSATRSSDDVGNTSALATPLTWGQPTTGTIDYQSDVDFFSVTLAAGEEMAIEASLDCRVRVHQPSGAVSTAFYDGVGSWTATTSGVHFVSIAQCVGPYSLLITH